LVLEDELTSPDKKNGTASKTINAIPEDIRIFFLELWSKSERRKITDKTIRVTKMIPSNAEREPVSVNLCQIKCDFSL